MSQVAQTGTFLRRWWPAVVAIILMLAVSSVLGLAWLIRAGADSDARIAQREFPGDRVEALMQYVQSESHSLRERNHAVWALGRLRDARALPVLRRYYTGEKCQHDKFLCQSELRKAIDLCSGKLPGPRWLTQLFF